MKSNRAALIGLAALLVIVVGSIAVLEVVGSTREVTIELDGPAGVSFLGVVTIDEVQRRVQGTLPAKLTVHAKRCAFQVLAQPWDNRVAARVSVDGQRVLDASNHRRPRGTR